METIIFLAGLLIGFFLGVESVIKLWNLKVREIFRLEKRLKKDEKEYKELKEELKIAIGEVDIFKNLVNPDG